MYVWLLLLLVAGKDIDILKQYSHGVLRQTGQKI